MSVFSEAAKNEMLDALTVDQARIHSGDPGAAGTANQVGDPETAALDPASGGSANFASEVPFTGLDPNQSVTWFSVWDSSGPTFKGKGEITSGDVQANAEGEFRLGTNTGLDLEDPA